MRDTGARFRIVRLWLGFVRRLVPLARRDAFSREWEAELYQAMHGTREGLSRWRVLWRARLALWDALGLRVRRWRATPAEGEGTDSARVIARRGVWEAVVTDARVSLRSLRRRPVLLVVVVLTLALGIGANTAVFSVLNAVLLRPLPYSSPDRLVTILPNSFVSNATLDHLRRETRSWEAIGVVSPGWLMALTGVDEPEQVSASRISGNMFAMLGVGAAVGQLFGMEAEAVGAERVAVLGHALWRRGFGGDPEIVGRPIVLDGRSHRVIGVAAEGFEVLGITTDLWTPLPMDATDFTWRVTTGLAIGRLVPAATVESATAELRDQLDRMREVFGHPDDWQRDGRVEGLHATTVGGLRTMLWLLMGAVGFVLLIACTNVANLMLVRAQERRHELSVRRAIGAGPARLVRLFLIESVWLALFGGVSGFVLAIAGVRGLRVLLPPDTPRLAELAVDGRVLIACVVMTLLAAAVFAAAPCAVALRESVGGGLRRSRTVAAGASRTRGLLVSVGVALALVLVAGASLMARTMVALSHVDPGFEADNLLTLRLQPSGRTPEQATLYWDDVLERVRAIPGVVSAGTVLHLPMSGRQWLEAYQVEGRPVAEGQSPPRAAWQAVSPGYFETARIPLVRGRAFLEADRSGAMRVAVINEVLAEAAFPAEDPLGRRIMTGNATGSTWATIVGVVGAVRHDSLTAAPDPELYVPFSQTQVGANSLVVRTRSDPAGIAPAVRERIRAVDPIVPIAHVMTMQDVMGATTRRHRTVFVLLGAFAAIGTVLGMVGIYGVVAYGVRQRVREIGIRMALGARRGAVARLLVREGLGWAAGGIAVGVLAALALTRLMRGLVFGVSPTDPATFVIVSLLLAAVAVLASWLPARRAARIEPTDALRT